MVRGVFVLTESVRGRFSLIVTTCDVRARVIVYYPQTVRFWDFWSKSVLLIIIMALVTGDAWHIFRQLWYRCYYPHPLRDSLFPVCGIFNWSHLIFFLQVQSPFVSLDIWISFWLVYMRPCISGARIKKNVEFSLQQSRWKGWISKMFVSPGAGLYWPPCPEGQ